MGRFGNCAFTLYSLAFRESEEYKRGVSSSSSGGTDYDSTGLRAALQLITPLLRCASLAKHTCF